MDRDAGRILLGLVLLVAGGELLVRGASSLAVRVGLSPLVVGLTVVSVATSSPELAVSVGAELDGQSDLAVGNVVGSNAANVLLILGISALVLPLSVREQLVRFDVPFLVGLPVLLLVLALDGRLSTGEGVLLLVAMVVHTVLTVVVRGVGRPPRRPRTRPRPASHPPGSSSRCSSSSRTSPCSSLGSCIANLGLVLGLPAVISSGGLPVAPAAVALDIPLMLAASVALLPVVLTGFCVARWEGGLFVLLYGAYVGYVVLQAINHDALEGFTLLMVVFVLPLVLVTLVSTVVFEAGVRRGRREALQDH
ncbi:sodium:calcium antiporter [Ornithinimicrobium sp. W1665]|uniref:sodium:calcium antiporter n=1 Tax=Ornithinimicrobium sp. W1665 TaxID=3416666 RepID=UPI003CEFBF3B